MEKETEKELLEDPEKLIKFLEEKKINLEIKI